MPAQMYYDQDADLSLLKGKTIAIIGYGSQGTRASPKPARQRLRGGRRATAGLRQLRDRSARDGFTPVSAADAAAAGDLINILLPDEVQGDIYRVTSSLISRPATCCSARTDLTFISVRWSLPRGSTVPWSLRRVRATGSQRVLKGGGVPCLIATTETCSPAGKALALAYAKGIGGTRGRLADDVRRGDRDRPLRRAGRPLRRHQRTGQDGLRNLGRSRLSA